MVKKMLFTILSIAMLVVVSCSKPKTCYYTGVPDSFIFLIKQNGERLADSALSKVKISYRKNTAKLYVSDVSRGINEAGVNAYDMGILSSRLIGVLSAEQNIKEYQLEFSNGDVHQLYVDYEKPSFQNNCVFVRRQVKYNDIVLSADSSITFNEVYVINY